MHPVSSTTASLPPRRMARPPMVTLGSSFAISVSEVSGGSGFSDPVSPSWLTQSHTVPILTEEVAQAACELSLSSSTLISASLEPAKAVVLSSGDLIENLVVNLSSLVETKGEDKESLGPEERVTVQESADVNGVLHSCPTIKELVGDLDKSWGNSKEWMLRLRDGQQIVLPLSLYRSPESVLDCSVMDVETVTGNDSFINEGQIVSWAKDCDGLVDSLSIVTGSEEMWELDERSMTWECSGKPLVVVPLATEVHLELAYCFELGVGCKETETVDSNHLSQWVTNRIKAFRKSVGTSLEGFEEQITGLLLAIEARKKNKKLHAIDDQMKQGKLGQKRSTGVEKFIDLFKC